ncbi:MAG: DUF5343 domain-containing protein [bacterium]|nr:DUF5343 domain-containing protein [bacterium]
MAKEIPYMASVGNVAEIIQKLRSAGTPPRFTHDFLSSTLGFRSSGDRGFIKVLRCLGMLSNDGTPTDRYNAFKNDITGGLALADGLHEGWSDLFLADQQAQERSPAELQQIFKSITGKGDAVAKKMATTFKAFADLADFSERPASSPNGRNDEELANAEDEGAPEIPSDRPPREFSSINLRHDVHLHLPPTSDVAVYTAIFRALREELLD